MKLHINSTASLKGRVALPASKSYSIRAFIIAACGGRSTIIRPSSCDDAKVAIRVAKELGAKVTQQNKNVWIVNVEGIRPCARDINVGESGTALRFLLPLLALRDQSVRVTGEGTLKGRPNLFLTKVLRQQGVDIRGHGPKESIPLTLIGGTLQPGRISIDGTLSSQFISALMIACPQLSSPTVLKITGRQMVSADYITMTRQVLAHGGVRVTPRGSREYIIKGGQRFKGLKKFTVPSDYGLAAFLMAAALLTESDVILEGHLTDKFVQADGHILRLLKKMGARFKRTTSAITIKGPAALKGGAFSLKDCPDLVPIMSVLALFAQGRTRLYDIGHARAKESDRISDLRKELLKTGAEIKEKHNELLIIPKEEYRRDIRFDPHRDHRLAMAFAVLGLQTGATIDDMDCVSKSYPDFVKDFKSLGAQV